MLAGAAVALWLLATVRHIYGGADRDRFTDRDLQRLVEVEWENRRA